MLLALLVRTCRTPQYLSEGQTNLEYNSLINNEKTQSVFLILYLLKQNTQRKGTYKVDPD